MPFSEKIKAKLAALPPERRANVLKLVAEKLANEKLRRIQQAGEVAAEREKESAATKDGA